MKWPDDFIDKVICGDCRSLIVDIPSKSVDIILTDPPYGMNYHSAWREQSQKCANFDKIFGDDVYPSELISLFKNIARKAVFMLCRWDNLLEVEKPESFIVWDKGHAGMGDLNHSYGRSWEGILFYPMEGHHFNSRPLDVIRVNGVSGVKMEHPTEKPVMLFKKIITHNTNIGDIVLDPFLGSGAVAVAARMLNRHYIGIDIDEKWCAKARERIEKIPSSLNRWFN